ncbi:hypothetical protein E4U54_004462 [Claviceps lovelessii]|nr:hypothetical protein E4U54_004462 [Claviceps lovelessii]
MGERVDIASAEAPFPLTDMDIWVLSQTDEEKTNQLSVLKRTPSDLRRYMSWTAETKAHHGTMTQYLLANRLPPCWGQPPFTPESPIPFGKMSDFKVLLNDWPYGLAGDIIHLVRGAMTPESRALVADFVRRYFVDALGEDGGGRVLWFKNWGLLQSVRALEHIHVLVRDADDDVLERWTGERPKRQRQ